MTKKIALIGLGYWGKNILRNLVELNLLHTACDFSEKTINEKKQQYPNVTFSSSSEDILNNQDISAIAIATPAATHYDFVKSALSAGKDVFVEKPLALTVDEGAELVEFAKTNNRILMVGHILQYHPAVITLKKLINEGKLGKIQYIYSNRLNMGKLRTEENILWSFAPHDISVILSLINSLPSSVTCIGDSYVNTGIWDTTLTHLEFPNNVKAHIFVSWLHPFKEQKLVVVGSESMAVFDDQCDEKLKLYPHRIEWKEGKIPIAQKAEYINIDISKAEPLKDEMLHFAKCCETREQPLTNGDEGLQVLSVLQQAEQSIRQSKGAS